MTGCASVDQQLLAYVTTARLRSFSQAARELYLTQPAVSQHVLNLERTLGVRLLERNNRQVELTAAGVVVYEQGSEILRQYDQLRQRVHELTHEGVGAISLGASYTYGEYVLPRVWSAFVEHYPGAWPSMSIANTRAIIGAVQDGSLDVGVIEGQVGAQDLEARVVGEDRIRLIAPFASGLSAGGISADHTQADLVRIWSEQTWLVREQGSGTREVADRFFAQFGVQPKKQLELGSTQVIKQAVAAGLGIALLSESALAQELTLRLVQDITPAQVQIVRPFTAIRRRSGFRTRLAELFWQHIATHGTACACQPN